MASTTKNKNIVCEKCKKGFRSAYDLTRHHSRKTPCDPIQDPKGDGHECQYCGKAFQSRQSMNRHIRLYCKISNTEDGMSLLVEHTHQRQLREQAEQIAKLTEMVEKLSAGTHSEGAPTSVTVNNNIYIMPWDGECRIAVSAAQMAAAFVENPMLREYMLWPAHQLTDPNLAPPYVTELFVDLIKRGHTNPTARNVYINPRRSDQSLVRCRSGKWEVITLIEATRQLLDGIAQQIHQVVLTTAGRSQLTIDAQNALSMAEMVYSDEPDEFAKRARAPLAAHLANTAPDSCHDSSSADTAT